MNSSSSDFRMQIFGKLASGFRRKLLCGLWLAALCLMPPQIFSQVTVFSEDFEGSFPASGGWTTGDDDPFGPTAYWNTVDSAFGGEGAHSGNRKAYCAGFGFGGSTANPNYQSDMIAFMSRSINLSGYSASSLSFWFKIPSVHQRGRDRLDPSRPQPGPFRGRSAHFEVRIRQRRRSDVRGLVPGRYPGDG